MINIDTNTIVLLIGTAVVSGIGLLVKSQFIDRTKRIEAKLEDVGERISSIEGKLDGLRSPWSHAHRNQ